ncbi:MAG: hypothetical protein DHS20C14_16020 [Phycisphaeraceae bacterium]|nr:MAG: hypothetical protein DHS20C14_16020 [Phycisphaeraceae bacterium]
MNACPAPPKAGVRRVTLDPDASAWAGLLQEHVEARGPLSAEARTFREQLGLPTDRPVVMSGHQAEFWHPGILAKLLAANALAARTGAAVAWLVVDQDTNHPFRLALPERDDKAAFRARAWEMGPDPLGRPTRSVPPVTPGSPPNTEFAAELGERLPAIREALRAHAGATTAAVQVTEALFDLLEGITPSPRVVYASSLAKTDLFRSIVASMLADPRSVQSSYNDAAGRHRGAGVRRLGESETGGIELPVWRFDERGGRAPAFQNEIIDADNLAPRGMLATGLMRLAASDVFVHGTGGQAYERINDVWLPKLVGGAGLAPFFTASADVLLVMGGASTSAAEAERSRWLAHHARHQPQMVGETGLQAARDELVAKIAAAPADSDERAGLFKELHALLDEFRGRRSEDLQALEHDADTLAAGMDWKLLAQDRAWPAVVHEPGTLERLRDEIEARFG